jgi:hypothetical protein
MAAPENDLVGFPAPQASLAPLIRATSAGCRNEFIRDLSSGALAKEDSKGGFVCK